MTPARATALVAALCAGAIALVLGSTRAAQRHLPADTLLPPPAFPPLAIARIDAHEHFDAATVGDAVRIAEANGIRAVVNLSGGSPGGELEAQLAAARPYGDRVVVFMGLDFDGCCSDAWAKREAARLDEGKKLGVRGLKVHKAFGLAVRDEAAVARGASPLEARVPVDSPALDPIWRACAALALPVVIHAGDPKPFFEPPGEGNERREELALAPEWSFSDRSRFPPWQQVFDEFVRLVERHPQVTFVGAHFGNDAEDPDAVARLMDRLQNLWVDTAARVPELARRPDAARAAILAHPDRVLFGTDLQIVEGPDWKGVVYGAGQPYLIEPGAGRGAAMSRFFDGNYRFFETRDHAIPSPTPIQGGWPVDGIGLPRDVLEKIYHQNAERLLGVKLPEER
jgi:predicted TIM-barrel fold metal-dependent hydrolase